MGILKKMGVCVVTFIVTGFLIAHTPYSSGDNTSNDSVTQDINENKYGVTYKNDEVAFNNWLDQSIRNTIDNLNSIDDGKITAIERVDIDKKVELLLQFQEITDREVYKYARKRTGEIVTLINQNL